VLLKQKRRHSPQIHIFNLTLALIFLFFPLLIYPYLEKAEIKKGVLHIEV
jgi:hypothetical protein